MELLAQVCVDPCCGVRSGKGARIWWLPRLNHPLPAPLITPVCPSLSCSTLPHQPTFVSRSAGGYSGLCNFAHWWRVFTITIRQSMLVEHVFQQCTVQAVLGCWCLQQLLEKMQPATQFFPYLDNLSKGARLLLVIALQAASFRKENTFTQLIVTEKIARMEVRALSMLVINMHK